MGSNPNTQLSTTAFTIVATAAATTTTTTTNTTTTTATSSYSSSSNTGVSTCVYLLKVELFFFFLNSLYERLKQRQITTEILALVYRNNKSLGFVTDVYFFFLYCNAVVVKISEHSRRMSDVTVT
jgi:hypothetical protein